MNTNTNGTNCVSCGAMLAAEELANENTTCGRCMGPTPAGTGLKNIDVFEMDAVETVAETGGPAC